MAPSYRPGLLTWRYQVRIPVGPDIFIIVVVHTQCSKLFKGMVCTVLPIVRTVHNKEPLKSFEIRVGHSPGFGLNSVAILP